MVSPAARPCGSPGWTLNFSMRDQVQVMSLQGKRLRAFQDRWCTPDGRLFENTDCSVLFKDCRGLLLLQTDEWHSKLQTQASEGALHRLDITVIQYQYIDWTIIGRDGLCITLYVHIKEGVAWSQPRLSF